MLARRLTLTLAVSTVLTGLSASGEANAQQATLERIKRVGEIRVCLDQNNLPYSSDKPETPGFDTELAQEIAKGIGVKLVPFWYATNVGKRALRQLHGENNCDFFPGLPHEDSFEDNNFKVGLSKPYYVGGFATLARSDAPATILADTKKKGVGVQLGTFSDFKLFDKGFERKLYKSTEELADAVEHKEIDAAVVTAPEGAWLVKSKSKALKVLPNTEKEFLFPMSVGVRKADKDLLAAIDDVIAKLDSSGKMTEILAKYGMVRLYDNAGAAPAAAAPAAEKKAEAAPEKKAEAAPAAAPAPEAKAEAAAAPAGDAKAELRNYSAEIAVMEGHEPTKFAPGEDPGPDWHGLAINPEFSVDTTSVADFPNDAKSVNQGRKLYKQACYKCHGNNGIQGGGVIPDVRAFASKNDHYAMFAVVQAGRPDRGMPAWNDYLTEDEIKQIIVYVKALHWPKKK